MSSQLLRKIPLPKEFIPFSEERNLETINKRFDSIVAQYGEKIAITDQYKTLTYSELKIWIDKVAAVLLNIFGTTEEPEGIGLIFNPCVESIVGIMGAMASGHFFTPISPYDPLDRIKLSLDDGTAGLIISTRTSLPTHLEKALSDYSILFLEDIAGFPKPDLKYGFSDPTRMCALLYSSGSTGSPKGTIHTHETLINMVRSKTNQFGISPTDQIGGLSSFTFGGYYSNFLLSLLNGCTLHLHDLGSHTFEGIEKWIHNKSISYIHCTPTTMRYILEELSEETKFPNLRLMTLGGESVKQQDIQRFQALIGPPTILGTTGATIEAWFYSSVFFERPFSNTIVNIPMGFIESGCDIQIWDKNNQNLGIGERGEIIVSSPCLSPGYWRRDKLNQKKFETGSDHKTYYKTGDIGSIDEHGILYHHGRVDFQVKIRGIRIETGEIENTLMTHPAINGAIVIARARDEVERELIAYLTLKGGLNLTKKKILDFLRTRLPTYMLPAQFILLEKIPQTRTGKIDREALASSSRSVEKQVPIPDPPQTHMQQIIFDIWSDVLGHSRFGISDSFFGIGGNSIELMRVRNRLVSHFGQDLSMIYFMRTETVEDLARAIEPLLGE